jgi:hypothetical protein
LVYIQCWRQDIGADGTNLNPTFNTRSKSRVASPEIEQAFGARPTGFKRADAINIRIPIEGAGIGIIAQGA